MKTERIVIPMQLHQKEWTKENAEKRGFDGMAAYIRWLIWKDRNALMMEKRVV